MLNKLSNFKYTKRQRSFQENDFKVHFFRGLDTRILPQNGMNQIVEMIEKEPQGNSLIFYNSKDAVRKLEKWQKKLPWIQPYYALKSNPIKPLLQDLAHNGCNFDCASKNEIKSVLAEGISPDRIVFSNPVKNETELSWAQKKKIQYTTADTLEELIKIKQHAPKMKILWRVSIKEENPEQLNTVFSVKFGDDLETEDEIRARFEQIKSLNIDIYGIHFHCGSSSHGSSSFNKAVSLARECMRIGRQIGHKMELLDIGGGFPQGDLADNIDQVLSETNNDPLGYKVIAEPGRHFSANTCHLAFRVMTIRTKLGKYCYHINDSLYHSFNCILMDGVSFENQDNNLYQVMSSTKQKLGGQDYHWASLFGMTCDGRDIISNNMLLPKDLQVGDWLVMGGMGSYTIGPKSMFNGMVATDRIGLWIGDMETQQMKFIEETVEDKDIAVKRLKLDYL